MLLPDTASAREELAGKPANTAAYTAADNCPLGSCTTGVRATVVTLACTPRDALRLRALGVCEGSDVGVVDNRNGIVLDVHGSRLALDRALAMTITVVPRSS